MTDPLSFNSRGEPMSPVSLTDDEYTELIRLIDDDAVDEDLLSGVRAKLVAKRKRLRQRIIKLNDKVKETT